MRTFILLCGLLLIVSCKSKHDTVDTTKKIDKKVTIVKVEEIDLAKKDRAYELGKRLLEACNTSRFKTFSSSEATDKVRKNASKDKISITCKKINQRYGRYNGLTLIDVTHNNATDEYIFRYSIDYEKKYFKKELKVTINNENKVSAISTQEINVKSSIAEN